MPSPVDQTVIQSLVDQIVKLSAPKKAEDGTEYYDPALGALVTAYNALKDKKDEPNVINAGGGKVGIYDPATGRIDWSQSPGSPPPNDVAVTGRGVVRIDEPPAGSAGPPHATTIPGTEPITPPTSTQANIDARDTAVTAHTNAETAAIETPDQKQKNAIAQINAQARAQADSALAIWQTKIDSGYEMKPKDELELKSKLEGIAADAKAQRDQQQSQFEHDLAQPNKDRELKVSESRAEADRVYQQQQVAATDRQRQTDVLKTQGAQTQGFIDQGIKLGVAPTAGLVKGALDPLMMALQLSRQAVQSGVVPSTAMPRPSAPTPGGIEGGIPLGGGREAPMPPNSVATPSPNPANIAPPVRGPFYG